MDFIKAANEALQGEASRIQEQPAPGGGGEGVAAAAAEAPVAPVSAEAPAGEAAKVEVSTPQQTEGPQFDDAQILAYLKSKGLKADSLDEVLKVQEPETAAPAAAPDRSEALKKLFLERGGAAEEWEGYQSWAQKSDEELVRERFVAAYLGQNPDSDPMDAEAAFGKAFFIGEEDLDFSQQEIAFGQQRLKELAQSLRTSTPLSELEKEYDTLQQAQAFKKEWEQQVTNYTRNEMPKALEIPLGAYQEKDLGAFKYSISEEQQREMSALLMDPTAFMQEIQGADGKTDLAKLFELMAWKRYGQQIIAAAAQDMYSKGIDTISSVLDNRPNLTQIGQPLNSNLSAYEEGVSKLQHDAQQVLGGRANPRRKPLSQSY